MRLPEDGPAILFSDRYDDVVEAVESQLSTASLVLGDPGAGAVSEHQFFNNEDFWDAVLSERLRSRAVVRLRDFFLFEWFPRSPGLFHTPGGKNQRKMAAHMLQPLTDGELAELRAAGQGDLTVYTLRGKLAMLRGGVGCLRLRDKLTEEGKLWFMSASASLVAHEGVPVGLPDELYERVIERVAEDGAAMVDLIGRLTFVPQALSAIYRDYKRVPHLYLRIEQCQVKTAHANELPGPPTASAAVTFRMRPGSSRLLHTDFATAYVDFTAGARGDLSERQGWLEQYVERLYDGIIVTDFDEHMSRFDNAVFSLAKVSNGVLDPIEISEVIGTSRFADPFDMSRERVSVSIDNLIVQQNRLNFERSSIAEIRMGDSFSNIGAGATIINRSLLNNALNQVSSGSGREAAAALRIVADHVQRAGSVEALENFEGLLEELERSEPRKSRLRAFWDGVVKVLPSVAQLGEASAKVLELMT